MYGCGFKTIKCDYCQEEKAVRIRLTDYVYKKTLYKSTKVVYFCGYNCMKKAEIYNLSTFI